VKPKYTTGPILALFLAGCSYIGCKPFWQFERLEQSAREVVTASELQAWATNLLTHYPVETIVRLSELGKNFPSQLRGIAPRLGPTIYVHVYEDTNAPSYVQLYWGSGFMGAAGFLIGSTNYVVSDFRAHEWQPGVYFYKR
jgi:hypothetical protein